MKHRMFMEGRQCDHAIKVFVLIGDEWILCKSIESASRKIGITPGYLSILIKNGKTEFNGIKFRRFLNEAGK